MSHCIGDDLLDGLDAIAAELRWTRARTDHAIRSGLLPVGRLGRRIVASRQTLRQHFTDITSGASLGDHADEAA
jgi:hypothetical protein